MSSATLPIFSSKTLVPLGFIMCLAPLFWWLTSVAHSAAQNEKDIAAVVAERSEFQKGIGKKIDQHGEILSEMRADIAGIDAKTQLMLDYLSGHRAPMRGGR